MKNESFKTVYTSPLGYLEIRSTYDKITHLDFLQAPTQTNTPLPPILKEAIHALDAYFTNPKYEFRLALEPQGTAFQKRVWNAMQKIPAGKAVTYGELAKKLETSARAVGQACRSNPIPIFIPCHRVIAQGQLGGFCGKRKLTNIKSILLEKEEFIL